MGSEQDNPARTDEDVVDVHEPGVGSSWSGARRAVVVCAGANDQGDCADERRAAEAPVGGGRAAERRHDLIIATLTWLLQVVVGADRSLLERDHTGTKGWEVLSVSWQEDESAVAGLFGWYGRDQAVRRHRDGSGSDQL